MKLNSVTSIQALADGALMVKCNITDMWDETYDCDYCYRESDDSEITKQLTEWLAENAAAPVPMPTQPYAPPTIEEQRAEFTPISRRQLRLTLFRKFGITSEAVVAILNQIQDMGLREEAMIEWEDMTDVYRMHPTLLAVSTALGITDTQIDEMWAYAVRIGPDGQEIAP